MQPRILDEYLALLGIGAPDAHVQVDPVTLPLDLIDLALAVLLAASLERQHLRVPRQVLQRGQHFSNGRSSRVAGVYSPEQAFEQGVAECVAHRLSVK